jgi:hypothetical protein
MIDPDLEQPSRQALAAQDRSLPKRVTGRLLRAITEMIWSGSSRADAAKAAGMTDHSLRCALRKPHVIAFYRRELGVLRESERSRTFHRLCGLRDQDDNKNAAVAAARTLEGMTEGERAPGQPVISAGFVIVVPGYQDEPTPPAVGERAPVIDVTPPQPQFSRPRREPAPEPVDDPSNPIFRPPR